MLWPHRTIHQLLDNTEYASRAHEIFAILIILLLSACFQSLIITLKYLKSFIIYDLNFFFVKDFLVECDFCIIQLCC
jgi:hypothetical protein